MNNYEFCSTQIGDVFEDIVINKTLNFTLNQPIYISVYANTLTAYQMDIKAILSSAFNQKLEQAVPLLETIPSYQYYVDEFSESFFSY